jgi:DNA-binding CsgD family transcriptional regulator/tetratricopeptide (TPR) repeat protein
LQRTGIAYLELGRVAEAEAALRAAESIATGRGLWSIATRASLGLSHIELFAHGDTAAALERAEKAATAAGRAGELRGIEDARAFELSISVRRGNATRAADLENEMAHVSTGRTSSTRYVASSRGVRAVWDGRFGDGHRLLGAIVGSQTRLADQATAYGLYAVSLSLDGELSGSAEAVARIRELLEETGPEDLGAVFFDFARLFAALAEGICGRHTSAQRLLKRGSLSAHIATSHAYDAVAMLERSRRTNCALGIRFAEHLSLIENLGFGGYAKCLAAVRDHLESKTQKHPQVRLTDSERRVLALLASGLAPKEVASELGRSVLTVQTHIQNIIVKFECHGRSEAIALAQRQHLI